MVTVKKRDVNIKTVYRRTMYEEYEYGTKGENYHQNGRNRKRRGGLPERGGAYCLTGSSEVDGKIIFFID
jgi:hypothetical protein